MLQFRRPWLQSSKTIVGVLAENGLVIRAADAVGGVLGEHPRVRVECAGHHHVLAVRNVVPVNLFGSDVVRARSAGWRVGGNICGSHSPNRQKQTKQEQQHKNPTRIGG